MIRIALLAFIVLLIAGLISWGWTWMRKNRVRIEINRPPTSRELYFLTAVIQVLRRLIRVIFRF